MARLGPSDVQSSSPLLTGFSVAYTNNNGMFIAKDIFNVFPVPTDSGAFKKWGSDTFLRREDTNRAVGGRYSRSNPSISEIPYLTQEKGHEAELPDDVRDNSLTELQIDKVMSEMATAKVLLELEVGASALVQASGSYASGHTVTLSGTGQFSNLTQSNPIGVVQTGLETVRSKIGRYPDTMVMSAAVRSKLVQNAQILSRLQGVQRQGTADITDDLLATILGVKRIKTAMPIVMTSAEGQTDTFADLWSDSVALLVTDEPNQMTRNFGITWSRWGTGLVVTDPKYREEWKRQDVYRTRAKYDFDVISNVSGYLIIDTLA